MASFEALYLAGVSQRDDSRSHGAHDIGAGNPCSRPTVDVFPGKIIPNDDMLDLFLRLAQINGRPQPTAQ